MWLFPVPGDKAHYPSLIRLSLVWRNSLKMKIKSQF